MVNVLKKSIEPFLRFSKSVQNGQLFQIYYGSDVEKDSRSRDLESTNQQNFYGLKT